MAIGEIDRRGATVRRDLSLTYVHLKPLVCVFGGRVGAEKSCEDLASVRHKASDAADAFNALAVFLVRFWGVQMEAKIEF